MNSDLSSLENVDVHSFFTTGSEKRNNIFKHSFEDGEVTLLTKMPNQVFTKPKIVSTGTSRVFILGGLKGDLVTGKCFEIKYNQGD
jgi:hypothetical protein